MATHASEESSSIPSEQYYRDRYCAYKKLLADLAQHLGPENVKVIVFNCGLPESMKQCSALDVLDYLDKHAKFSPTNIQLLAELLKDAYRNDLVNDYVDRYRLKYGRHSSVPLPRSGNQHQAARRRAVCSGPGVCPPVQEIGDSPENNPFSPTEDTLHEDESARNQFSNETQPPSVKTQPLSHLQTLTATNNAHSKTVHQFNDQIQPGMIQSELQMPQGVSNRTIMSPVTAPLYFRRTSTPMHVHQSHHFCNHSGEYGTATPSSISSPSSMHEINDYHNPLISGQEMPYGSSAASANASQDLQPTTQLEHSPSSTHTRSRGHHLWYTNSSQGSLLSAYEQAFGDFTSQYPTENNLSNESVRSKPTLNTNGGYIQVFTTAPPDFHQHTSSPAATSRSAQKQSHPSCFTHASCPRKKISEAGSTVSDSGVEMVGLKTPSAGPNSDIIEPWMSVSNEQSWTQPRPRVTSVSTGVQTEGENGSEKAESPASGSPTTSSSPQHPHDGIESEGCSGGQDSVKHVKVKKHRLKLTLAKSRPPKPQHTFKWDLKRNTLNKKIYKHKEKERLTCKKKLELDAGCGGANPRLVFHLIPYGLEDDAGKSATLEIEVEISRKTRMSMHSATTIRLSVFVQEMKEDGEVLARHDNIEQSIDVSRFFISRFLTHECLKHSRCDQIQIWASAELIPHSEHPHTPRNSK